MQNLKFGVLVCGLLGLVGCFLPFVSFGDQSVSLFAMRKMGGGTEVILILAGFAAALAMGAMAAAKGMQRWMSIVALIGFAMTFVMMKGETFQLFKGAIGAKLIATGAIVGLIFSILTIAKPEPTK